MLTRFTAILLIGALSFQFLMKVGILVDYTVNKAFITNMFCVNKDKPQLHCDGKCHLAKELKKADAEDKNTQGSKESKLEVPVFLIPDSFQLRSISSASGDQSHYSAHSEGTPSTYTRSLFRPPV